MNDLRFKRSFTLAFKNEAIRLYSLWKMRPNYKFKDYTCKYSNGKTFYTSGRIRSKTWEISYAYKNDRVSSTEHHYYYLLLWKWMRCSMWLQKQLFVLITCMYRLLYTWLYITLSKDAVSFEILDYFRILKKNWKLLIC